MFLPLIIRDYFVWHYGRAWWQMWGVWRNYIWYVVHVFSIPQLLRSWFAPYKRMTPKRGRKFSGEDIAAFIIINVLSRVVGAVARTVVIVAGLVALCVTIAVGFFLYTVWMILPVVIIALFGASVSLFFISL